MVKLLTRSTLCVSLMGLLFRAGISQIREQTGHGYRWKMKAQMTDKYLQIGVAKVFCMCVTDP